MRRLVLAALLAALATAARAESPRHGSFELMAGQYRPNVDTEFATKPGPWETVFGRGEGWMLRAGAAYDVLQAAFGSLEVGLQAGYFQRSGLSQSVGGGSSGDTTSFKMIPTSATLTYRFDWLADRHNIPLVPYGRLALDRYNWWVNDGAGHTSKSGATNGWSAAFGLCLLLDFFDPTLAREMDQDIGINHTYVFGELRKTKVNDFGLGSSWDLSDSRALTWSAGMLFVF